MQTISEQRKRGAAGAYLHLTAPLIFIKFCCCSHENDLSVYDFCGSIADVIAPPNPFQRVTCLEFSFKFSIFETVPSGVSNIACARSTSARSIVQHRWSTDCNISWWCSFRCRRCRSFPKCRFVRRFDYQSRDSAKIITLPACRYVPPNFSNSVIVFPPIHSVYTTLNFLRFAPMIFSSTSSTASIYLPSVMVPRQIIQAPNEAAALHLRCR